MSQTIYKIEVENVFFPESMGYHPDNEECESIIREMIEDGYITPSESNRYGVNITWYDVGEGESDTGETVLTDKEIIRLFTNDTFDEELDKRGIEYMIIQNFYENIYCE